MLWYTDKQVDLIRHYTTIKNLVIGKRFNHYFQLWLNGFPEFIQAKECILEEPIASVVDGL